GCRARRSAAGRTAHGGGGNLLARQPLRPGQYRRDRAGDRPDPRRRCRLAGAHRRGHPGRDRGGSARGADPAQFGNRDPLAGAHVMRSALIVMLVGASLLGPAGGPDAAAMSIERVTGASGVEAWLVEDHSIPIVTLSFAFPGGAALDPAGKERAASMGAGVLDEGSGTLEHTT